MYSVFVHVYTHAQINFIDQVTRGGRVKLREISQPTTDDWGTALEAIQVILASASSGEMFTLD